MIITFEKGLGPLLDNFHSTCKFWLSDVIQKNLIKLLSNKKQKKVQIFIECKNLMANRHKNLLLLQKKL